MYRKIVWCYIIVLTLLDLSLNTKLTAQGKSHGVSVHESLAEGITFQEWGGSSGADAGGGGAGRVSALRLSPAALRLGPRALGRPHAATVTLTNAANTTLHLASVAGTTPDFHASFFDSKTLPPDGNTTFSVVYLGRREGPVSAHLYIHTSLGVHKYPVSAEGVASEWGVWPLLGLRVPHNATLQPVLTLRNPTDTPVQVSEVYSSGSWVRLSLPGGPARAAWLVPPRGSRDIVRLAIQPPHPHLSTAYVRIKSNATGGGAWVVGVEARGAPAGEWALPAQLRLRPVGAQDPPTTWVISVGSSAEAGARLEAGVVQAQCAAGAAPEQADSAHAHNGVKTEGAQVKLLKQQLEPRQPPEPAAELTLDYEKLWAGFVASSGAGRDGALCSGVLRLNRAALPYSVRLLPGTLRLSPPHIHFVTADREKALKEVELTVKNEFNAPLQLTHLEIPKEASTHFLVSGWRAQLLPAAASVTAARVRLRPASLHAQGDFQLVIHTNVSDYTVPLRVYSGKLDLEWEWPASADGTLRVGAVGVSVTRHVGARLVNRAPRPLCVRALAAELPGAQFALVGPQGRAHADQQRCIPAGGWAAARLTLVAPARAGALRGAVLVSTPHADTRSDVTLTAHAGHVHAAPLRLDNAAPYVWADTAVVVDNSMNLRMRILGAEQPPPADPALQYTLPTDESVEIGQGRNTAGLITYMPERRCEPHCYTGLQPDSPEGALWVVRAAAWADGTRAERAAAARADRALLDQRRRLYQHDTTNITLQLHTEQVVGITVTGTVRMRWPRLAGARGWAGLAGLGASAARVLRARNPSWSHPLLLHAVLGPPPDDPSWEAEELDECLRDKCVYSGSAFSVGEWWATRGVARTWGVPRNSSRALPLLLLQPGAEVDFKVYFAPKEPVALSTYLYLRNNLTIVEVVQLAGRGAVPSFELGGRRPGDSAPLLFEVTECGAGGVVRRQLTARNTGLVRVTLRDWRLAGRPCGGRGFTLQPCAPLTLLPNESAALALSFTPDYTLARVSAELELRAERARGGLRLAARAEPRLLRRCAAARPPWEPALRGAGTLLALALLALVLAAAALDAERLLRRARAARQPSPPRAPLDLRALCAAVPLPAPRPPAARPPAPRRRRPRRPDPAAESRAFERWRAERSHAPLDDERSSEDAEPREARAEREGDADPLVDDDAFEPGESAPPAAYEPPSNDAEAEAPASSGDSEPPEEESESESSSPPEPDDDSPPPPPEGRPAPDSRGASPPRTQPRAAPSPKPRPPEGAAPRRREPDGRRAAGRPDGDVPRTRSAVKHHQRKDKPHKRRERPPVTPPPRSPPASPRPPPAVRWGASWSSVVARSAAPPPPPPPRPPPADHSLFYYSGEPARPQPEYGWRAPHNDRPFAPPTDDFIEEPVSLGSAYGSIGPVWGSSLEARAPGAAWPPAAPAPPPGAAVRPPPGFGSTPTNVGPVGAMGPMGPMGGVGALSSRAVGAGVTRGARPFDPFHSLADIWLRTALDWPPERDDDSPH